MLASRPAPLATASPDRPPRCLPRPVRMSVHLPVVVTAGLHRLLDAHADRVQVLPPGRGDLAQVDVFDPDVRSSVPTGVPRVALTWDPSPCAAARARDLGAVEVLLLDVSVPDLVRTVERVHAARTGGGTDGTGDPDDRDPDDDEAVERPFAGSGLSAREVDVVVGICRGLSNAEIADQLFVSVNSVKTYIRTAYRKMGVGSRSQAVLWGIQHGF